MSAAADTKPDARAYSKARMQRIGAAMYGALLQELRDANGVVVLPSGEILDAMAMLGGIILASWPDAKVPSRLRLKCEEIGQLMAQNARAAIASGNSPFDFVLPDPKDMN